MAKTQFLLTEKLYVIFEPFINPSDGSFIESGDTAACDVTTPSGTTTLSLARDPLTKVWVGEIAVLSAEAGLWLFRATSSDSSSPKPQYRAVWWGVGLHAVAAALPITLGTPVTSIAGDIAAAYAGTSADIAALLVVANAAVSAATAAQSSAADASSAAASTLTIATFLQKIAANRWKIIGTQLVYYEDNGTTVLATFNLKDSSGSASSTQIFERVPV